MQNPEIKKIIANIAAITLSQVGFYFAIKYIFAITDPSGAKKADAKSKASKTLGKMGVRVKDLQLNEYEEIIAAEVVHADDINVTFKDVGGLDHIVGSLRESVIFPLCYPQLFTSTGGLLGSPKGVLLYGPPGCGKTMLAKALAKESGATFINLHVSTLTDKWFGESNKLVSALFSLAHKLQPAIIFIDEIDSFLRERQRSDHEVTGMMKAEFMSLWDGLTTSEDRRILVLGATNRPNDIDAAILRRMPKRFPVRLPNSSQRRKILEIMLKDARLSSDFDMDTLVVKTNGRSGSDIKELCRNAAMIPIRDYVRQHGENGPENTDFAKLIEEGIEVRPLSLGDFFEGEQHNNHDEKNELYELDHDE